MNIRIFMFVILIYDNKCISCELRWNLSNNFFYRQGTDIFAFLFLYNTLEMTQNREENKNHMTLYDFVCFHLLTESNSSTIHRAPSRLRSSLPIKCSVRRSNKPSTINLNKQNKVELPLKARRCTPSDTSRMYEFQLFAKEKEQQNVRRVMLSNLTGRSHASLRKKTTPRSIQENKFEAKRLPSVEASLVKSKRSKAKKRTWMEYKQQTLNDFFSNYERVRYTKLDGKALETIRSQVIRQNANNLKLLL